ncbi:aspartate dehydrogenase domain-containing protein [Agrobacterium leguminum]|uniref:aspartate dehydrogenase domain-containing protein n=1 Tax=Agrobacterium leguminum TaxID=2792015 RepID=UPI003CE4DFA9
MDKTRYRVGIIGGGTIGRAILEDLVTSRLAEVDYVLVSGRRGDRDLGSFSGAVLTDVEEASARPVDLVIEAALPEVLARVAPTMLQNGNVCGFSCTALADRGTEAAIRRASGTSGFSYYVPHGAILALDGLADGRDVIETVTITTAKSGKSLGMDDAVEGVVFEGAARDVCARFPRNVNVHAAIALAGIGFDRTVSRVVAVPGQEAMEHRVEVTGQGFTWDIRVSSQSLGGVTGAYTPRSAIGSVRRILARGGLTIA